MGYVYTETEGYDICWTMPHCVLSLKLIGLTFDCYDGERARRLGEGVLSKDQRKSFLPDNPSLLEMLSHRWELWLWKALVLISVFVSASSLEDTLSGLKSLSNATGIEKQLMSIQGNSRQPNISKLITDELILHTGSL